MFIFVLSADPMVCLTFIVRARNEEEAIEMVGQDRHYRGIKRDAFYRIDKFPIDGEPELLSTVEL